jgi:hypothetical protein
MRLVGALLALCCVSLGAEPGYRVQMAEPEAWRSLLATVGLEATATSAPAALVAFADAMTSSAFRVLESQGLPEGNCLPLKLNV